MKTRVVIADSEPVWRLGVRHVVQGLPAMEVSAEAGSVATAREACERERPDLLLIDTDMEGGGAFLLVEELPRWSPATRVVIFSRHMDGLTVQRALRAKVFGVLAKSDSITSLGEALQKARAGNRHLSPTAEEALYDRIARGALDLSEQTDPAFSKRELQIFRLMGEGQSTRAVAGTLALSIKTVETHQARMKEKLGARTSVELRQRAAIWTHTAFGG